MGMLMYPSKLDLKYLAKLILDQKFKTDSTGVLMMWAQGRSLIPGFEPFAQEIAQACNRKATYQMINILQPGVSSGYHRDPLMIPGVKMERWHLPIVTNLMSFLVENTTTYWLESGYWHGPLSYWEPHCVINNGSTDRIHMIVDLDPRFDFKGNKV